MILVCFSQKSYCTSYTWSGLGLDGQWTTKANWGPLFGAPANYPSTGDDVIFNEIALGYTVTMSVPITVKSITINGVLSLLGTITLNNGGNALTVSSALVLVTLQRLRQHHLPWLVRVLLI
ncbi:hypothetical protein [Mucilaginibacter sp.]|uniref:hypothetical protein n=1 Tax=Mucilaginibacter sp. TaxID=1882438 RepID=UPI003D0DB8DC